MLGWELPPRITGGLGVACAGLIDAMAAHGGIDLSLVMPRPSELADLEVPGGVRVLSPANESLARVDATRMRPHASVVVSSYTTMVDDAWAYAELARYVVRQAPPFDVIHAHDWLTFRLGIALRQRTRKPLVAHVHSIERDRVDGAEDPKIVEIEAEGLREADCVIAVSDYSRRRLMAAYGTPAGRIRVVHNGLPAPQAPAPAGPRTAVTFAGRITAQKNPFAFVHAARSVLSRRPGTRFVMAGDGDLLPAVRDLVAALGMTEAFTFPGFVSSGEVRSLLRESAVFVMPSHSEPFGLVAGEAIQCGAPVVLSRHSGILELLDGAVPGVDPLDTDALAGQVLQLLDHPAAAADLAARTATLARGRGWDRAAATIAGLYGELVAARCRPVPAQVA